MDPLRSPDWVSKVQTARHLPFLFYPIRIYIYIERDISAGINSPVVARIVLVVDDGNDNLVFRSNKDRTYALRIMVLDILENLGFNGDPNKRND